MRFSAYILFLLAVCIPLYLLGFHDAVQSLTAPRTMVINQSSSNYSIGSSTVNVACANGDIYCQQTQGNNGPSLLWAFFAVLLGAFILVSFLTGFAAMYVIPAILLVAFINFVIIPYSFLTDVAMPWPLPVLLFGIFNTITVLAVADFIRGGA